MLVILLIDGKYNKVDIVEHEPVTIRVWDTYTHSGVGILDIESYEFVCNITSISQFLVHVG